MILFWLLVGALAVIVVFPETQVARTLRHSLVDEPARILREMTLRKLARGLLVVLVVAIAAAVAPEMLALMMSLGDVGLVGHSLAAHRFDFGDGLLDPALAVGVVGDDIGAIAREPERELAPDAAAGAGDERDLAGQGSIGHQGSSPQSRAQPSPATNSMNSL